MASIKFYTRGLLKFAHPRSSRRYNDNLWISRLMFSSDPSGSDGDGGGDPADDKSKRAKRKLDALLKSIVKDNPKKNDSPQKDKEIDFKLAIPIKSKNEKVKEPPPPIDEVLKREVYFESTPSDPKYGEKLMSSIKSVAKSIEGSDPEVIESELVQKLTSRAEPNADINEIFKGMKITKSGDRKEKSPIEYLEESRGFRVKKILEQNKSQRDQRDQQKYQHHDRERFQRRDGRQQMDQRPDGRDQGDLDRDREEIRPIKLFDSKPLGIFTSKYKQQESTSEKEEPKNMDVLKTWSSIHAKELKLAITRPPDSGFEEMIQWTEKGKMWHFPINNEQGLEEQANVSFTEHVFLEPKIDSWCPKKGPIRHFMHLVCVGLSKNPYLLAKEKDEYLEWYHEYFKEKKAIIKSIGAGDIN